MIRTSVTAVLVLATTLLVAAHLSAAGPGVRSLAADPVPDSDVVVDEPTERLIDGALKYLAWKQSPSGAWEQKTYPTALTGYALMAFMSAGQLPDEGPYGKTVTRGMQYLVASVHPDGYISAKTKHADSNMYGHGIATIALAELYGQTRNPDLRPKLELAAKLIVKCQNDRGGWRYAPEVGDADISVTVLQVVALRAAKNAGLDVPQATIDRAIGFVKSCYDAPSGGFTYQPQNHMPGFARTAAAIYSLQVCGKYDDPTIKTGSEYLFHRADHQPEQGFTIFEYGLFYAAPAQYMIGGDTWKRWYPKMTEELKKSVVPLPGGMYNWPGAPFAGPVFTTSVYITILAMPYHYLPLYQR